MTRRPFVARLTAAILLTISFAATADLTEARRLADHGEQGAALNAVDRHLRAHPTDPAGRFLKARLLAASGQRAQAIEIYRKLADDLPDQPEPRNNLAALYAADGEVEKARRELLAALATHPSYAAAFDNLQTLHARLASIAYRRALGNGEIEGAEPLQLTALPAIRGLAETAPTVVASTIPKASPAPTTETAAPTPSQPAGDSAQSVLKAVKGWAAAWSAKDIKGYLSHYAKDYRPADLTSAQWREQRKQRLSKPRVIRVTLKELRIRITGPDSAQAIFEQDYSADTYADRVIKQLTLKRDGDGWKIVDEQTISVLG